MSSRADSLADQASLALISKEVEFFRYFALSPFLEPIRPIAVFALMPFIASFVFDSAKYLREEGSPIAQDPATVGVLEDYEKHLSRSRLRLKISKDKNRSFDEILKDDYAMMNANSMLFGERHRGPLAPLKNLLQDDLGAFFMQDRMFCTTHISLLDLGLTNEDVSATSLESLGPYLHERMRGYGRYMGRLLRILGVGSGLPGPTDRVTVDPISYRDLKGKRFYESMARQISPRDPSVCMLLMSALSRINTARMIAPQIEATNTAATFKIQFLSVYHAASSLHDLLREERGGSFLTNDAIDQICTILNTDAVERVCEHFDLRNVLVHYRIAKRRRRFLSPDLPLFGLVEAHTHGASRAEIARDVGVGLASVADGLQSLMPRVLTPQGIL